MQFGAIAIEDAIDAILAHSVQTPNGKLPKGLQLTADHIEQLKSASVTHVTAAKLSAQDVGEDDAATRLAKAIAGTNLSIAAAHTGRVNLFATAAGVVQVDRGVIDAINRIDESITIATLAELAPVAAGQMVATVKIIPLAAPGDALDQCEAHCVGSPPLDIAAYHPQRIGFIQTHVAQTKQSVLDKTRSVLEQRLEPLGSTVIAEQRCTHDTQDVSCLLRQLLADDPDLILMIGASAIIDRRDVLPSAVIDAGGTIDRFGMPVDPGNLLMMGQIAGKPVLGLPGCARSIKLNGFDWVLQRLAAGIPIGGDDIAGMGVGGLLSEIPSRPQPRIKGAVKKAMPEIAIVMLAAGQSRRMGPENKLLAALDGKALVNRAVEAAIDSKASEVVVVTGHEAEAVQQSLGGLNVRFVHCPDAADGLSRSLRSGIQALGPNIAAAIVCLGDMPYVTSHDIDRLIDAYDPENGATIIATTFEGKRGNPVLWDRRYFDEMTGISGDVGARHLIGAYQEAVREVAADAGQKLVDIDTPEALAAARVGKAS